MPRTIDDAFQVFERLIADVPPEDEAPINEANTRFQLIDPLLQDVLGWRRSEIVVEEHAGEGRLDYLLHDGTRRALIVVEAKRRSHRLVADAQRSCSETLRFSGPVLRRLLQDVVRAQMMPYLAEHLPSYAIVTNGEQWVGFLHRERPYNQNLSECRAVVFRSLDAIKADFERFFEFFGAAGAKRLALTQELAPELPRGSLRPLPGCEPVVPRVRQQPLAFQERAEFYRDLDHAMRVAFQPLIDDTDALKTCFVNSRQSQEADHRLERMALELQEQLTSADLYPERVRDEATDLRDTDSLQRHATHGHGFVARLLGEPHAGKTVFLKRFYAKEATDRGSHLVKVWIDAERFSSANPGEFTHEALIEIRSLLFPDGMSATRYREVFRGAATLADEDGLDSAAFIQQQRSFERQHGDEALAAYFTYCVSNRRQLPCLVLDNIDSLDDPAVAIRWAIAIHRRTFALTTIAMKDETLWRLRADGCDQLESHVTEQFWLPRPKIREVLQKRLDYLQQALKTTATGQQQTSTHIGRGRGIRWSVDADALVRVVTAVLLDQREVAHWLGALCNYDLAQVLHLCQRIVRSPHVQAERLLAAQVAGQTIAPWRIIRAIVAPQHQQFQARPDDFVINIFGVWDGDQWAPMLHARLLAMLEARRIEARNRRDRLGAFIPIAHLRDVFDRCLGVRPDLTLVAIDRLLTAELVQPFDPSRRGDAKAVERIQITERGLLHLEWAVKQPTYVRLMAEVDPIIAAAARTELVMLWKRLLTAMEGHGREAVGFAEHRFVCGYVTYCLAQAAYATRAAQDADVAAVAAFEQRLRTSWAIV